MSRDAITHHFTFFAAEGKRGGEGWRRKGELEKTVSTTTNNMGNDNKPSQAKPQQGRQAK